MLTNREIVIEHRSGHPTPVAAFDLAVAQLGAVADALAFYQRRRFQGVELDADIALAKYGVTTVSDQAASLAAAGGDATMRLDAVGVGIAAAAVGLYLAERDVDSHQTPEERARIDLLRALIDPLLDLGVDMRGAERELRAGPVTS